MMNIEKLPKWAQEHIEKLSRERDVAIRALNQYVDNQTPSEFYIDEMECTGEEQGATTKKRYIQTYRMNVKHKDVHLSIMLRDSQIELQWGSDKFVREEVAFIPQSHMSAKLVNKKHMW